MIFITKALEELGVHGFILSGEPTNDTQFKEYFTKIVGEDSKGHAILSKEHSVTWAQVVAKKQELEAEHESNEYQRLRQYPSLGDQLDMLWHAIDTNSLNKTSDFYTAIKAVKDAHPKG